MKNKILIENEIKSWMARIICINIIFLASLALIFFCIMCKNEKYYLDSTFDTEVIRLEKQLDKIDERLNHTYPAIVIDHIREAQKYNDEFYKNLAEEQKEKESL